MGVFEMMEGLEQVLATIPGLRTKATAGDQVMPPQAIVGVPPEINYQDAGFARRKFTVRPTITILTSSALDRAGQMALARYIGWDGDQSILAAIEADRTLGGAVEDVKVLFYRDLAIEEVSLIRYWGGRLFLEAMMKATE